MELRIRQRIFAWTDSYDVFGQDGEAKYEVRADFFAISHRIRVFEKATGREIGYIQQRFLSLLPSFEIVVNGETLGSIRRKFTLFRQDYEVDYMGWDVAGDFLGWDYRVNRGERQVMTISKELLNWSDTYVLRFADPADEVPGLMLVLAIDAANCTHND